MPPNLVPRSRRRSFKYCGEELAARQRDGMLSPRLLVCLDEAGNCAALAKLPELATTARGQGIQLVTVWHDLAQLTHRYGRRSSTVLNGHRAKLFLSGQADAESLELASRLIGWGFARRPHQHPSMP